MTKREIYNRRATEVTFGYIASFSILTVGMAIFEPGLVHVVAATVAALFYVIYPAVERFVKAKEALDGARDN